MFGWPMVPSADLPGGGPAYPLSAPGCGLHVRPNNSLDLFTGVFNGSPVLTNPVPWRSAAAKRDGHQFPTATAAHS